MCPGAERPKLIWTEGRRCFPVVGVAPRLVLKYNIRPGLSQAGFLVSLARSCASR